MDISKLTEKDLGRWVVYKNRHWDDAPEERGRIKGWNDTFIFVVYKCNEEWDRFQDFTGQATDPLDLRFVVTRSELEEEYANQTN